MIFLLLASHPKPLSPSINNSDANLVDLKMVSFVATFHVRKLHT